MLKYAEGALLFFLGDSTLQPADAQRVVMEVKKLAGALGVWNPVFARGDGDESLLFSLFSFLAIKNAVQFLPACASGIQG